MKPTFLSPRAHVLGHELNVGLVVGRFDRVGGPAPLGRSVSVHHSKGLPSSCRHVNDGSMGL